MDLLVSFWNVIVAVAVLIWTLIQTITPWTPLIAWVAFWLLAVNWQKLYPILMKGGWIGVALIAMLAVLIWSSISIPPGGMHHLYGLHVSNIVGKTVYVSSLLVIAILCGSVQLSGCCSTLCRFEDSGSQDAPAHH